MITRGAPEFASAPASPSSRAPAAPSDSEPPADTAVVVDVTGGEEPWTATSARRTSDPPPLRSSKRASARSAPDMAPTEARKGKKQSTKRKIFRDSSRFAPRPASPDTETPVSAAHQPVEFSAGLEGDARTPSQATAIQPLQTLRSGSTIQSPTAIQPVLAIQPAPTLTQPKHLGQLTRTSLRPAYECSNNPLAYTWTTNPMATSSESWLTPTVSPAEAPSAAATREPPSARPRRHLRPVVSGAVATMMHSNAGVRRGLIHRARRATLARTMATAGVTLPPDTYPKSRGSGAAEEFLLDVPLKHALSEYIRRTGASLPVFVELFRDQTAEDYRPNKNLVPAVLDDLCKGYRHLDQLHEIVREGVQVRLQDPPPRQLQRPPNHGSARDRINVLRKNIRKEQDSWRCLVLDMDLLELWPEIVISPFGVVDKGGEDSSVSGRTIHDLSYPEGTSINDCTDQESITRPDYAHCDAVATETIRAKRLRPGAEVKLMAGDVASAFRNISIHSKSVYLFAGLIEEENALVIELSAPFGWTGSPGIYEIVGGAISYIHGNHTNATYPDGFFNYHWVDDHINVAVDVGSSCVEIDRSLRFAMVAVLGADAINDKKFTAWGTRQRVLGLEFDSTAESVSMPPDKVEKARRLVAAAYLASHLSRKAYRSLMGSLRHVATCVRAARPFLQRLRIREGHLHRYQRVSITVDMKQDLLWWWLVLHTPHLNGVSMAYFNTLPPPDTVVEMDASDVGLCALDVFSSLSLTYAFSQDELDLINEFKSGVANGFDINFRELLSCAFAVHAWGHRWSTLAVQGGRPHHVHFRIDNTSAVAWQNKMASRNPRAQVIIRLLSWWETSFCLRFSASHVSGSEHSRADAGSRIPANSSYAQLFASLTPGWSQVTPTVDIQGLTKLWQRISEHTPLPTPRLTNTGVL